MKAKSQVILAAVLLPLTLSSCGTMKVVQAAKEKTSGGVSALADASWGRLTKPKVPVVEVREKDLKELPTGEEQAVAFDNRRKRSFWGLFSGPVDYKEPTLPVNAGELDAMLLPPIE
ncbi:MAG: hypothetical protein EOP87_01080 [Verrucomicrobiaceae bacterium]|nr:MAG: hypothetical protein EOP87_01080 [Verrucomicrobiaceae bacterium]